MGRLFWAAALAAALAGCTAGPPTPEAAASAEWAALSADVRRAYAASYQEIPFAKGAVSVVAAEQGELRTYRLVPCGTAVCAWSVHGRRGQLQVTPDYWVVRGLFGREFWLSPGGDGGLRRHGRPDAYLAWGTIDDGRMGQLTD